MKKNLLQFSFVLALFTLLPLFKHAFAASLQFDPATVTSSFNQVFQVKINVDSGTDKISAVDARILYDQTLLDVQDVTAGTFFPSVSKYISHDGKLYVAGMVDSASDSKNGAGTIATVQFIAKKEGTGNLTFDCSSTSSTKDSNIIKLDANATDIIQCVSNGKAVVTIGAGSSSNSPTGTNSSLASTALTPTPAQLMRSGVFENTQKYIIPGFTLLLIGSIFKLLLI